MSLTSCEEVIELELENAESKIVIDAVLDVTTQNARVLLTKSNGFYEAVELDFVADAIVNLTLIDGTIINLPMVQNGVYFATGINVMEDDVVTITVIDDEATYVATEKVPHNITIDSLEIIPTDNAGPNGGGPFGGGDIQYYQIFTHWKDVENKESFYRIKVRVNDTLQTGLITISNDINRNGAAFSQPVFQSFEAGDTVGVELLSIDEGSYRYLNDLSSSGPGFGATTPFNPKSNFTNDALGYFGIVKSNVETVILPE